MSDPYPGDPPPQGPPPPPPPASARPEQRPREHSRVSTGQILGGLLFVVVIVFVVENTRTIKVRLLIPEVRAPLAVALLIAAVLGALVAWLLRQRRQWHRRRENQQP